MTNILFISEDFIKTNSGLNDNLFGKSLLPAIREAQDVYLQQIIGSTLYQKLINLINEETIGDVENAIYKELLDEYVRSYMLYQTIVQVIPVTNVKLSNYGTTLSDDQYLVNLSQGDAELIEKHYSILADFYARRLQEFILNHCNELNVDVCTCEGIRANLKNAATCGIFLGGERGRRLVSGPVSYKK
jgi:hypothetical protein